VAGEVLAADKLQARAEELAHQLAGLNPILLRNTRHVFTRPWKRAMADDLHLGLALESIASLSARQFSTEGADA
jgi:hypothetical protein